MVQPYRALLSVWSTVRVASVSTKDCMATVSRYLALVRPVLRPNRTVLRLVREYHIVLYGTEYAAGWVGQYVEGQYGTAAVAELY